MSADGEVPFAYGQRWTNRETGREVKVLAVGVMVLRALYHDGVERTVGKDRFRRKYILSSGPGATAPAEAAP